MPDYRRVYLPGHTVFLTLVTYNRTPLFANSENVDRLRWAAATLRTEMSLEMMAAAILPDHVHFLWTLPPGDSDYSKRVGRLKVLFTRSLRGRGMLPEQVSRSRQKHRESDVWQRRFWEHTIRDEMDWQRHLNYLHYNPVKHGLVACPHQWAYSSFDRYVQNGLYEADWGCQCGGRVPRFELGEMEMNVGE
ncbi:transposase [filamentous cyanobacterium CCP1]|nr:transposase [filamentous cyanobacterium CCP2]PSB66746.1 transposase [filamentous cyanobacterium CCP1]